MNALIESSFAAVSDEPSRGLKEKILLVDDEPVIRQMLTRLLAAEGYDVLSATGGAEALALAECEEPDLVLLDLNMPGMDGWDTHERLATKLPLLPIIVITARPNQKSATVATGIGALMEKPLDLQNLFVTIRQLLDEPERSRLARIAGRPSDFHYAPPATHGSEGKIKPWRYI